MKTHVATRATAHPIRSKLLVLALSLCAASACVSTSQAATVRFANQGDVLSLDPHSLNEAVQLAFLNNVYESLVTRGKDLKLTASLDRVG